MKFIIILLSHAAAKQTYQFLCHSYNSYLPFLGLKSMLTKVLERYAGPPQMVGIKTNRHRSASVGTSVQLTLVWFVIVLLLL